MAEIPVLLLAAGASRRMGQAKQLLPWGETTLIEHQLQTLLLTEQPVLVVLGHLYERFKPLVEPFPVQVLNHQQWEQGMGSSIAFGIRELEKQFPRAVGVLIAQMDQALVTPSHFNKMLSAFDPGSEEIIVSRSASGWEGVPVIFDQNYFKALKHLKGEEGARRIFRQHSQHVIRMESSVVLEDIDTPEVYEKLLADYKRGSGSAQ